MEKLNKRSDGIFETSSGLFAVLPKRSSGTDGEFKWFDFRPTSWGEAIRIRWPTRDTIAVIDQPHAVLMFNLGYGTTIRQEHADEWNERIDFLEATADAPALDPAGQAQGGAASLTPPTPEDAAGGAAIDPQSLLLEPTPEEIAEAAAKAAQQQPETVLHSLGAEPVKTESEIGTETPAAVQAADASLVPSETSPENQTDAGDEPKGKQKPTKRTLS